MTAPVSGPETFDLDDYESLAATEREIVFGRLADLHARLAEVEELLRIAPRVARECALWSADELRQGQP